MATLLVYIQLYIHNSKATCSWVVLYSLLIFAVYIKTSIQLRSSRGPSFLRYIFLSSSFPQTLHSRYSRPVNLTTTVVKYVQMALRWKTKLTLSLSTSSSTSLIFASSPIPYSVMACSSSSLDMYLQLLLRILSVINTFCLFSVGSHIFWNLLTPRHTHRHRPVNNARTTWIFIH